MVEATVGQLFVHECICSPVVSIFVLKRNSIDSFTVGWFTYNKNVEIFVTLTFCIGNITSILHTFRNSVLAMLFNLPNVLTDSPLLVNEKCILCTKLSGAKSRAGIYISSPLICSAWIYIYREWFFISSPILYISSVIFLIFIHRKSLHMQRWRSSGLYFVSTVLNVL